MIKPMKVHLYDVICTPESARLGEVLQSLKDKPIEELETDVGESRIRLEAAVELNVLGKHFWLMDFANARYDHGPGRVAPGTPIADFELGEGEGFGEETAALYDVKKKRLLVQYNHYGPRAQTIAKFLSIANPDSSVQVSLLPKLDLDSEVKLAQSTAIRSVTAKVATIIATDEFAAAGVSVKRAAELGRAIGGETVTITISAPHGGWLNLEKAQGFISSLKELLPGGQNVAEDSVSPVETLRARAVRGDDGSAEVIDLILPRLCLEMSGLALGAGLRYTQESRWSALRRAREQWQTLP